MPCHAVCAGAMLKCMAGLEPSELIVLPANRVYAGANPLQILWFVIPS
jgi:hypothetical protein